jgi:hypothetical protein
MGGARSTNGSDAKCIQNVGQKTEIAQWYSTMGWMIEGSSPCRGWEFFFSPLCPH